MNLKMIHLAPIKLDELSPLVQLAFKDDADLITKFHIQAPGTFEDLVNHTFKTLQDYPASFRLKYYRVLLVNVPIGYVVTTEEPVPTLLSFGINIKFRKKNILLEWLRRVHECFNDKRFVVHLYLRNERAIAFFLRNNFNQSVISQPEGSEQIISLCH